MNCIKFCISGRSASFTQPVTNKILLTFKNIHNPAILGVLGAKMGLDGHNKNYDSIKNKKAKSTYPEYYELLRNLKISIIPNYKRSLFHTYNEITNNSSGLYNRGNSLQINRQYLHEPSWDIYVFQGSTSDEIWNKLKMTLLDDVEVYPTYLGKSECFAEISDVEELIGEESRVDSYNSVFVLDKNNKVNFDSDITHSPFQELKRPSSLYFCESLPVLLNENCRYVYEKTIISNHRLCEKQFGVIVNEKSLYLI